MNVRFSAWGPGSADAQAAIATADHAMSLLREGIVGGDEVGDVKVGDDKVGIRWV